MALQPSKDSIPSENKTKDKYVPYAVQPAPDVNLPVQPVSSQAVKVPVQADEFRKPSTLLKPFLIRWEFC